MATAEEKRLTTPQPAHVVFGNQRLPNNRYL